MALAVNLPLGRLISIERNSLRLMTMDKMQDLRFAAGQQDRPMPYRRCLLAVKGVVLATILYLWWWYAVSWRMSWTGRLPLNHNNVTLVDFDDVFVHFHSKKPSN